MTYQFYITDDITHGDGVYNDKPNREFLPFEKFLLNIETNEKILNDNYDTLEVDKVVAEIKKLAPHEEKIDTAHDNYDYCYARCNADDGYKSLGEQQDMQYWDAVNGTTTWKDHITAVKEKYPKT
jgi:hypothetical protein